MSGLSEGPSLRTGSTRERCLRNPTIKPLLGSLRVIRQKRIVTSDDIETPGGVKGAIRSKGTHSDVRDKA